MPRRHLDRKKEGGERPVPEYEVTVRNVVEETFYVPADSWREAVELSQDGSDPNDVAYLESELQSVVNLETGVDELDTDTDQVGWE